VNPVTVPEVSVAVQWKFVPAAFEVKGMFVDSPEQMEFVSWLLVIIGTGVVISCTVSMPLHPLLVTVTL
jgi:hypothetical protein